MAEQKKTIRRGRPPKSETHTSPTKKQSEMKTAGPMTDAERLTDLVKRLPRVITFVSLKSGYSFPDPRYKAPLEPWMAARSRPPTIKFMNHFLRVDRSLEPGLAEGILARIGGWIARGEAPEIRVANDGVEPSDYMQQAAVRGPMSTVNLKQTRVPQDEFAQAGIPEPTGGPEPAAVEAEQVPPVIEDDFAPAPTGVT